MNPAGISESHRTILITVDMDGLDRSSGLPPYLELANQLRQRINDGTLTGALPSERELAADWRVSKTVVRRALEILRGEGLIETYHGYGSRVVPPQDRPSSQ